MTQQQPISFVILKRLQPIELKRAPAFMSNQNDLIICKSSQMNCCTLLDVLGRLLPTMM